MFTFVVIIHIIVCIMMVLTVLLQQGKGAEIGAVFGSSETIFGSTGPATFLGKLTTALAVIFMITSLSLTYLSAHKGSGSIMEEVSVPQPQPQAVPTFPVADTKPVQDGKNVAADKKVEADKTPPPVKGAGEEPEH